MDGTRLLGEQKTRAARAGADNSTSAYRVPILIPKSKEKKHKARFKKTFNRAEAVCPL
jgi:hypothetical protein